MSCLPKSAPKSRTTSLFQFSVSIKQGISIQIGVARTWRKGFVYQHKLARLGYRQFYRSPQKTKEILTSILFNKFC